MKKFRMKSVLVLIIVFLVVVFGGRWFMDRYTIQPIQNKTSSQSTETKNTPKSQTEQASLQPQATSSETTQAPSCSQTLSDSLAKNKQTYVKGQILVTFTPDQTYETAKAVLAVYGLSVRNEVDSTSSFSSRHLITAAVAPGDEIAKVCELRGDSHVKYAGLDLYFTIHQ
jgi:cytoskeletal protein RodZ